MGATARNPDHAERRESPRRKASQWQTLWVSRWDGPESGQWIGARLLDYTDKGIGIEVSMSLAVGARVVVKAPSGLSGSGGEEKFRGRVRWCQELAGGSHHAGILLEGRVEAGGASGERGRRQAPPAEQHPPDGGDYYDLLQLSQQADPETVHRIYRILAQRYHPDNQETGNEDRFKQILEAYRVLSDPEKRAAYDAQRRSYQRVQWKVFDQPKAAAGLEGEKRKRGGILSLLYTKRVNDPDNPTATIHELEDLLGCPREHLQVSLWFLKEKGWITRSDNGRYAITVDGFEEAERTGVWPPQTSRLLEAPAAGQAM